MFTQFRATARMVSLLLVLTCNQLAFAQTKISDDEEVLDNVRVIGTHIDLKAASAEVAITPGGIELIDMEQFRERNVSSLADILRIAPGIWSTSDSGNDSIYFSSRGSNLDVVDYDMNGIKLLQDGLPVTAADGNNHNRIVDPLSAQYIVIARGANAMIFGASTLGGAINFVSTTAQDGTGTDLTFNTGSFGQVLGRATFAGKSPTNLDGLITAEAKTWDGYREHNEQDRYGFYGNAGWQVSDSLETRFYGTWVHNDQQLPGSLTQAEMEADPDQASAAAISGDYQLNVDTWRLASKTTWLMDSDRRLDFGVSLEEQSLYHPIVDRVMVDFDGPGPAPPVEVFSLLIQTEQRNIGASIGYNQQLERHDLIAGINVGHGYDKGGNYRNLNGKPNGFTTLVDNDASLVEAFLIDRWKLSDPLTFVFGAQVVFADREVRNTDVQTGVLSNPKDDYSQVNPRIGLLYDFSDEASVYANFSQVYEPPTNFQLQDNVLGGNATLDAMTGNVVEAGSRGSLTFGNNHNWGWDVSIYYGAIHDEILSVEDPLAPGTSLTTNVDHTTHAGIEALLNATFSLGNSGHHFLAPLLSLTVNNFNFDDDPVYGNNQLPAAPDYALRGEISYSNINGFHFGPTFDFIGSRYADFANTYLIDSYALLGLLGGWEAKTWSVNLEISNILDKEYVANFSVRNIATVNDAILNPGAPRSAYITARWKFD